MSNVIVNQKVSDVEVFSSGIVVDDKGVDARATLNFNQNKGLVSINVKITDSMITGDVEDDEGMLLKVNKVIMAAIKKGMEYKNNWTESKSDPNQTKLEFGLGESEDE